MKALLPENLEAVSGGSPYSVGYSVGAFAASCVSVFAQMGNTYVTLL